MAPKQEHYDLYTFVAGATLETSNPFPVECNCGGVVTIMPRVRKRNCEILANMKYKSA